MGVDRAYFVRGSTVQPYDIDNETALDVRWELDDVWEAMPPTFAAGMDAALDLGPFSLFSFRGADCLRIPCGAPVGRPRLGLDTVDAAMTWGDGTAHLFSGDRHVRYDIARDRPDPDRALVDGWPGIDPDWVAGGIDAALNPGNGLAYLFRGDQFVTVDWHSRSQLGAPRPIEAGWKGLTGPFDAAWCGGAPPPPPAPPRPVATGFLARCAAPARAAAGTTRVPALVALGRAAMHSDWGRNAPGHDLFGLGPAPTVEAAFAVHGRWLSETARFAPAFTHRYDPFPFARAVAAADRPGDAGLPARLTALMHQIRRAARGAVPRQVGYL